MRKASLILLAIFGSLGCSGRRLQPADGADGGSAGAAGGSAGTGAPSAGGSTGTAGIAGGGGAAPMGNAGAGGSAAVAGGAGAAGVGGGGVGGSGPTGGTGGVGGSGSSLTLPRFLFIGPIDPSGSLVAGREYSVVLNGASDDGSVVVGSSMFYDTDTSTPVASISTGRRRPASWRSLLRPRRLARSASGPA